MADTQRFTHQHMPESVFDGCSLARARFTDVNLCDGVFSNVDLRRAKLTNVNLAGASIEDANIEGLTIFGQDILALIRAELVRQRAG